MSRFNKYNNIHDPDDDGADIEITPQDHALSDDLGRETATTLVRTANAIKGTGKHVHDQRRMFYRWAKKELIDGRARREAAAASEKAAVAAENARVAAVTKAEKEKGEKEAKIARNRERLLREGQESDEMWARINEETVAANAAWAAGKEERERTAAQQPALSPVNPVLRREDVCRARPQPARQAARPVPATPVPQAPSNPSNWPFDQVQKPLPPAATRQPAPAPSRTVVPVAGFQRPDHRPVLTPVPTRTAASPSARPPTSTQRPSPQPAMHARPASPSCSPTAPSSARKPVLTPQPAPHPRPLPAQPLAQRTTPPVPAPAPTLSGSDLAGWRASAGLTQRAAAERLGVAPSTVAKAELLPDKALGEQLRVALNVLLPP